MSGLRSIIIFVLLVFSGNQSLAATLDVWVDSKQLYPDSLVMLELYRVPDSVRSWSGMEVLQYHKVCTGEHLRLDLPVGRYALRGYIDLDGNQKLTKGPKARPEEPFGFSLARGRAKVSLKLRHAVFDLPLEGAEVRFDLFSRSR